MAARPPGTATRLTTGQAGARPGTRGGMTGGGVALNAQVKVADRPMTQQGLGGMKTAAGRGPQRQIQDKTYYLGLLRSKITELTTEINNLNKETETASEDQSKYVTYEKRAEKLACELKELQGELGDYNTLVDKLNTDESVSDIQMEMDEEKVQNDKNSKMLDAIFEQKKIKEDQIAALEHELHQERSMTDNMVADMNPEMKNRYMRLKEINNNMNRRFEEYKQELDHLQMKKIELEEELSVSPVKQEAVRLYAQLHELEDKRDQLMIEAQSKGTPEEEREKLLRQVKDDNQEIAIMEKQINELKESAVNLQEDIRQLDIDIEENQGERSQQYKELKKREETMTEFLNTFETTKAQEIERISQTEADIVVKLEHMSRNLARFHHLPTPGELNSMKDDLQFKEIEMKKSENTASGLASDSHKLAQDLQKVEQLEAKVKSELETLKAKIDQQTEDIALYSDLDKVRSDAETRKTKLSEDKVILYKRRDMFKTLMRQLSLQYESLQAQLKENETHAQLGNLEKKWQHHEQNNFVMKEFIASKTMETDYHPISNRVDSILDKFNKMVQDQVSGKSSLA